MNDLTLDQKPEGWDPVAPTYDSVAAPFMAVFAPDAIQLADVKPRDRVLDVAAGTGALGFAAAKHGADVLATDFSPGMIDYLREKIASQGLGNMKAAVMDGQVLDVADNSFDAAISLFGLMFFPDRSAGFRELYRVIKPGGRAVVVTWSNIDRLQFMQLIMGALKEAVPELPAPKKPPLMLSIANRELLKAEMQEAGFGQVNVSSITRSYTFSDPENIFEGLSSVSPTFSLMFGALQPDQLTTFRTVCMQRLREQGCRFEGEAHIAVSVK